MAYPDSHLGLLKETDISKSNLKVVIILSTTSVIHRFWGLGHGQLCDDGALLCLPHYYCFSKNFFKVPSACLITHKYIYVYLQSSFRNYLFSRSILMYYLGLLDDDICF